MWIGITAIGSCMNMPDFMTVEELRVPTLYDEHLGRLYEYVLHVWPSAKAEVWKELQPNWSLRDDVAIFDEITMKG